MNRVNICSAELGAEILDFSSTNDDEMCQASNVLLDQEDKIWNSEKGLPQYLIINLQKVEFNYDHIDTVIFNCWHDYPTNPKKIDIEIAISPEDQLTYWVELTLKYQNGKQEFKIPKIPSFYKILKFSILETFGDDETYLNQIMLMATPFNHQSNSQMSVNELQYCSYQKDNISPQQRLGFRPQNSRKSRPRKIQISDLKEYQEEKDSFHSVYSESRHKQQDEEHNVQQNEENGSSSFDNNVALLGLSQKMMEMEESVEAVRRNLEILDLKVNISYETLEKNIMEKVQKIVDKKIKKVQEELRAELRPSRKSRGVPDVRQVKSQKDKLQFISSRQMIEDPSGDIPNPKGRSSRDLPKSLHIQNLNQGQSKKEEGRNNPVISGLMTRLAQKLKQRDAKVKKMQSTRRQKYEHC